VEEHQCTSCGATLPRTGTYCLACDTPVAGAVRGLSVGEIEVVQTGRPLLGIAIGVGVLVVAVGLVLGLRHFVVDHANGSVSTAAKTGVDVVVLAEGGHPSACPQVPTTIAGDPHTEVAACRAVFDDDPGAHLVHLRSGSVTRHGSRGTADLRATLVDRSGKRAFDRTVDLVQQNGTWMLSWDGSPLARS
jgi:hypothetical protein